MAVHTRREFLSLLASASGAAALGWPASNIWSATTAASAATASRDLAARAHDWDWLVGSWDVWHRRLKERLAGDTHWEEFAGKSSFWRTLAGLGNLDDNIVELPGGTYRGLTVRAYDPAADQWAIWWVDGRDPMNIDVPVRGRFEKGLGTFFGNAEFKGRPIIMRFKWQDLYSKRPWWEQAFSPDDGKTWEVNWRNWFTRTSPRPSPVALLSDAPKDFAFLVGSWKVHHRKLRKRLVGNNDWDEFDGTLVNWPVLGGHGNVGDNVMNAPSGTIRGIGLRTFDPKSKQWSSWWLDGRTPTQFTSPQRGAFVDGIGTLLADDELDGRPIKTRVVWSHITANSARWEQACSADGGKTWEMNWISHFQRAI